MTWEMWDVDQAVTRGPIDEDLDGCDADERYGVTATEELAGEPLAVALEQEQPDLSGFIGSDDQWLYVDDEWELTDRLLGDPNTTAAEESAMHVVTP